MIYLDYAADTPADREVLDTFCAVSREFCANPNSPHPLGLAARKRLDEATAEIAELLHVKSGEIIYTSGASESNNLAIKGAAQQYRNYGRHIVTTPLEHSSVSGPIAYLQSQGFEVDTVGLDEEGRVDLADLKSLLREDTVLVSVCYVDSELGIRQDVDGIARLLSGRPHCFFHVDATQAVGKVPVSLENIDLCTFAPHKFYGLCGLGLLIKKERVLLEPQIHGGISTTPYRSGTPSLSLIAAAQKAIRIALEEQPVREQAVKALSERLRAGLSNYPQVRVNSTAASVAYILNVSISGVKAEAFAQELGQMGICVATKSACCAPNTISRPVYALTKDRRRALSTLRLSLSHLTTGQEIDTFLSCFEACCKKFGLSPKSI